MPSTASHDTIRAVQWQGDRLRLLDQRCLPAEETWIECTDADAVREAITGLAVRGAPAIGIAAAWGVVLAARAGEDLAEALAALRAARPTAVNLMWALDRMKARIEAGADVVALAREAQAIQDEDLAANRRMGELGAALIEPGSGVLTHCNTGSLATAGYGTALGVIRAGVEQGRIDRVFAGETRPWLQGARLTMWELLRDGIPAQLIADAAAAHLMHSGQVQWVDHRCRPYRRQRRRGQQDRQLRTGHRRPPSRREIHGGGAFLDRGHGHGPRRGHRDRVARPRRAARGGRCAHASPRVRRPGTRCSTSRRRR